MGTEDSFFPTSLLSYDMVNSLQKGGTDLPLVSQLAVVIQPGKIRLVRALPALS
jgi:hypothetical protein